MKLFLSLLSLLALAAASIDVFYQQPPDSKDSKPSRLARVSFDPSTSTSTLDSFTPPEYKEQEEEQEEGLVAVGLYVDGRWTSSLTTGQQMRLESLSLIIHLDQNSQPFHVDVDSSSNSNSQETGRVQVVPVVQTQGTTISPQLSAPVEAREEEVPEKTLLQR